MLQHAKLSLKNLLSRLTRRWLGPHVESLLVRDGDFVYLVDPADNTVGRRLRRGGYGREERTRVLALCDADSRVLFVGTHIGTLAIPTAAAVAEVIAIEANPETHRRLCQNIAINGVDNLTTHCVAASDRHQSLPFLQNRSNSGGSKIKPRREDYRYVYDRPEQIDVPGVRLDDLLAGQTFDVIVMDIEGSEYAAMCGMPNLIASAKHLCIEFVPHHLRRVAEVDAKTWHRPLAEFKTMHRTGGQTSHGVSQIGQTLRTMYDQDMEDDCIVFSKVDPVINAAA